MPFDSKLYYIKNRDKIREYQKQYYKRYYIKNKKKINNDNIKRYRLNSLRLPKYKKIYKSPITNTLLVTFD